METMGGISPAVAEAGNIKRSTANTKNRISLVFSMVPSFFPKDRLVLYVYPLSTLYHQEIPDFKFRNTLSLPDKGEKP
jgi:hypothetical protein